jgi:hypothetical protein
VNNGGRIVEVHEGTGSDKKIWYRVGHMRNPALGQYDIVWDSGTRGIDYEVGENPKVSINDQGDVLEMHQVPGESILHYLRGTISNSGINFPDAFKAPRYRAGASQPAVALTNLGRTLALYKNGAMYAAAGLLATAPNEVDWSPGNSMYFTGFYPAIASNGNYAIAIFYDTNDDLMYATAWVP